MKWFFSFLLMGTSIVAWTQTDPPIWIHDVYRKINYPVEKWHTGFVQDRMKIDGDVGNMLKIMERDAINQLAESIIVTIESETQVENINQQRNDNDSAETMATNLKHKVKTFTSATLINLEVYSFYNPSTDLLYAFAAIKRSDLLKYYQNQITVDLSKLETAIAVSRHHITAGEKSSACIKIKEAQRLLDNIRFYRTIINVGSTALKDNNLQPEPGREDELQRTLEQLLVGFNMDILVYINCQFEQKGEKHDALKNDPSIFCNIIAQALNENKCIITDDIEQADFELKLIISTTQRSDGNDTFGIISYYANVKGSLYDLNEKKHLVDFFVLNNPKVYAAGRSPEDAAIKAFKLPVLKDMVMEKILPAIIH